MREERPSDTRGGEVRVLAVESSAIDHGTLAGADGLAPVLASRSEARRRLGDGTIDCLVCSYPGDDAERLLELATVESVPSVACVPDDASARDALDAGATEVYRHDGPVDERLLARRIHGASRVPTAGSDAPERPSSDGAGPSSGPREQSGRGLVGEECVDPPEGAAAVLSRMGEAYLAVDDDWQITRVNEWVESLLDRRPEELVGRSLWEAFPDQTASDQLRQVAESGKPVSFEQFVPRLDQWFAVSAYPNPEGLSLYVHNITEQKRRERELREYQTVVETIPDGAWVLDADGRFVAVNDEMVSMTGYDREQLLDSTFDAVVDQGPESPGSVASEECEGPETVEATIETAEGDPIPCEIRFRSFAEDGQFGGTVGIARDLTDQRRRERRLRRLLGATRYLMSAETEQAVARTASRAASEVLDFPGTGFRLYDPESETLNSVALGGNVTGIDGRPPYPVEDSPQGEAFRSGETVIDEPDDEDDPYDREVFEQTMYVPVGEYGVLSVGLTDGELDDTDRQFAELLATSTEAALERAQRQQRLLRYEGVIEQAAGMVFALDTDDRFTLVSQSMADCLGQDREALVGAHLSTILHDESVDDKPLVSRLKSVEGGQRSFETTVRTADGDRIPTEIEVSLLTGDDDQSQGAVGILRDITELERTREQLADERDRFTYLYENLPDAVAEVDFVEQEATIRSVNAAFENTFGDDATRFAGAFLDDFVLPPGLHEQGKHLNQRAAAGEAIETQVRRLSVDGIRHFLLRVVPYDETDDRTRSFTIYTDITEQKQRERYLRVLNRVLRHNLRNDLNVVQGYAERLMDAVEEEALEEHARKVRNTVDKIALQSEAAREIQDAIRHDRGSLEVVDLTEATEGVVEAFRDHYPDAEIRTDLPDSVAVEGGPKLELVVDNLVENAIVHNTGDSAEVQVSAEVFDERVTLSVEDDGPGIPEAERAVVGEDREITQLEHGSGLGLWVVKWLVEHYGGRVEFVDSELGGAGVEVSFHRPEE